MLLLFIGPSPVRCQTSARSASVIQCLVAVLTRVPRVAVQVVNCLTWTVYGFVQDDVWLYGPNTAGLILGAYMFASRMAARLGHVTTCCAAVISASATFMSTGLVQVALLAIFGGCRRFVVIATSLLL